MLQGSHNDRREERGQGRPQPDVPDAQRQQRDEDAHGLLLKPAQHQREGQVVDAAAKGVGQRQCDADGAVGVIALAHVQDAGQAGARHGAKGQVVQAELAAGQGQQDGVGRGKAGKLGVVAAAGPGAVAAAHQKEVPQLTVPHRLHDLVRVLQHGGAGKTGGHRGAAVQAG